MQKLFCRQETSKEVGFTISILLLLTFERKDEINFPKEEQIQFYQGARFKKYEVSFIIVTKQGRKSSFKKQKVLPVLGLLIGSSDILLINFHDV